MSEKTIKAITLYQPWASLVAIGAKMIETRSWATNYCGELAIHSSNKMLVRQFGYIVSNEPIFSMVQKSHATRPFPFWISGCVVAVCNLVACVQMTERVKYLAVQLSEDTIKEIVIPPASPELELGDYTPGRWAWILDEVRMLRNPIPATGHQRLWNFTYDDEKVGFL